MYYAHVFSISALYLSFLLAHAIPIKPSEPLLGLAYQKRASYSIVAVDGSLPPQLSAATTPIIRTIIRTIDDTKTVTELPSGFASSNEPSTSVFKYTVPKLIILTSIVTSTSKLWITTTEIPSITQYAIEAIQTGASFDIVNPAGESTIRSQQPSTSHSPAVANAEPIKTASKSITKSLSDSILSVPSYQAQKPSSTAYSPRLIKTSSKNDLKPWHNSYRYMNSTSLTSHDPCRSAASTGTATVSILPKP